MHAYEWFLVTVSPDRGILRREFGMSSQHPDPGKGRRPFAVLHPPSFILKTANPATPRERTTPHHNGQPCLRVSTTYSTIAARALSFQGQLLTGATPLLLAQNGLYYKLLGLSSSTACCFACGSTTPLSTFQRAPIEELRQLHVKDCIWQVIYPDLKSYFVNPEAISHSTANIAQTTNHQPLLCLGQSTNSNDHFQLQYTVSKPVNSTRAYYSGGISDHGSRPAHPAVTCQARTKPQSPQPACSPQPPQSLRPTPKATSTAKNQSPTYASVLQRPATSPPQSTSKTHQSAPPSKPTLKIEDPRRRFHKKPSLFELDKKTMKRPANRTRNKTASATQSLSRFLNSASPAFSRFLAEMQPDADNCCPSYRRTHHSRAMRAA